jgi:pimeloyl-ACP methyl ester carboxylesterase
LIDTVAQLLKGNYEQVPQHEGKVVPSPIFGSPTPQPPRVDNEDSTTTPTIPIATVETGDRHTTQQMLIQAYMKLLDTVTALDGDTSKAIEKRGPRRVLVTVHGIGSHTEGYSNLWWQSLQPHVGSTYGAGTLGQGRQEVIWSDLVNRARSLTRSLDQTEVNQLRQSILDVIEDRRDLITTQSRSFDYSPQTRGSDFAIDDFLIYMFDDGMRQQIIDRFTRVVEPLLVEGATVDVISHSWGTVVAYEGLRELEQKSGLSGRVGTLFTVGSALSIPPVQGRLRPANRPTENRLAPYPKLANEWVNLDAQCDLVGGRLGRKFPVNREYLELLPTTCPRQLLGFGLVYDFGCAHGSYFQPKNLKVNRDIFAQHILGLARGIEEENDLGIGKSPNGAIESYNKLAGVNS